MTQNSTESTKEQSAKNSSKIRSNQRPTRTLDEIIRLGEAAASLLNSDAFNDAYQSVFEQYQAEIVNSQAHETNKREFAYTKIQVLSDVAQDLAALYHSAEAAVAEEEASKLASLDGED